jgi:NADPH-dependent 2,4-dienoyl-CoA reductase/sulfur reductase-like enzyme
VVAAETLRKLQASADVTLIGDEPEAPYSRMALPYYLVKQIAEEGTHLRKGADHFAKHGITVKQDRVSAINRAQKQVSLASGEVLAYDKLLLATGSRPVAPPIPGMDLPGIFSCWTLADARNIAARAKPGAKVLLMGAGFIGCIILEALAQSGAELTVVEMEGRMVPRMMNDTAGNMIKDWCESRGVKVHTSTKVTGITKGTAHPLSAALSTGQQLEVDLIVSATGVRPNIGFLQGTGLETGQGILINRHMQTNDPDIFAAGDVAEGRDFSTCESSVQAIQPTAT